MFHLIATLVTLVIFATALAVIGTMIAGSYARIAQALRGVQQPASVPLIRRRMRTVSQVTRLTGVRLRAAA